MHKRLCFYPTILRTLNFYMDKVFILLISFLISRGETDSCLPEPQEKCATSVELETTTTTSKKNPVAVQTSKEKYNSRLTH
ncbi:hypothetical protein SAMN04488034_103147 [Salinimicrobium catena]|uniref:Uncharacterized protein n=1 Tax=Salinimicrobium catena TaxID=390640 RepID=A0A1H5MVW2_9FLAO|nr:hypothetical protein SAMN04488140_103147 [Salinimicrobium catena]SEE93499.1 hypothetical protein SAMN04488034_103147 [Salinimicrobium catena]